MPYNDLFYKSKSCMLLIIIILACLSAFLPTNARADTSDRELAVFASNGGNTAYLATGLLLPLVMDGEKGKEHSLRAADALLTTTLITTALKQATQEKRPEGNAHNSFPSGHASAAFSIAAAQSHFHPNQSFYWYGGAALISWSRVRLQRHYTHDVIAGAALGYFTTKWTLSKPRGLILTPFIRPDKGLGVQVSRTF